MKNIIIAILIVAVAALGVALLKKPEEHKETAYERIIRTGTLRCGYALYEPLLGKDANTGALHGIFYDLVNDMGKELGLKVEWAAEVGYGEIEEGFQTGKYDLFCNGVIPTPKRAKFSMITAPVFYSGMLVWVRNDDHRFDGHPDLLNSPDYTLVVRDGDINADIAEKLFPKAKTLDSPQMADFTQMLVDVQTGKADATFFEKTFGENFLAQNPGTVRPVSGKPVFTYPIGMMLPPGEAQLKNTVDVVLQRMILNGNVKRAIEKNAPNYSYLPVRAPYETAP